MKNDSILINYDDVDIDFIFDQDHVRSRGIDDYIGFLIKEIETKYKKSKEESSESKEDEIIADPSKLFLNPGSVNYEDIIAYQKNKKIFKKDEH